MSPRAKSRAHPEPTITIKEAAAEYAQSVGAIRRWIATGRLRAYRVGPRSIRIDRKDLDAIVRPIAPDGDAK